MKRPLTVSAVFCCLAMLTAFAVGPAQAEEVALTLMNEGVPLQDALVVVFLSYGTEWGMTDSEGNVLLDVEFGTGFWVEVNGERLAQFFFVAEAPYIMDVAEIGTMDWPGR